MQLTFYKSNRYYLLGYGLLCLLAPLLNMGSVLPTAVNRYGVYLDRATQYQPKAHFALPASTHTMTVHPAAFPNVWHWETALEYVLLAGMLFMLIRLLIQAASLLRMKRQATLIPDHTLKGVCLYSIKEPVTPFSFGNSIFVHLPFHEAEDLDRIWNSLQTSL